MLELENLSVSANGTAIVRDVNMHVSAGETVVLFGPNGSGKTTLLMAIMGSASFRVTKGAIRFGGKDITHMPIDERARLGIGMMFQRPPTVNGVKLSELVSLCGDHNTNIKEISQQLQLETFIGRSVNDGFSGGEIKRSELLQLTAQGPELLLLDEPESGVDLENITIVGRAINEILEKEIKHYDDGLSPKHHKATRHHSGLIITHTGHILDYVRADRGIVMLDGSIICEGNPYEILDSIRSAGYQECSKCAKTGSQIH